MQDQQGRELSRRGFLAAAAGVLAAPAVGSVPARAADQPLGGLTPLSGTGAGGVRLSVDPTAKSSWSVARSTFGMFFEVIGRKAYPAIIDQHLSNGSFEQWWIKGKNSPPWYQITDVLYNDTPYLPGLAYPWEPMPAGAVDDPDDGVEFEMPTGGVHGLRVDEETSRFQRVRVQDATGGVRQRLALPDERTLDYDLGLSVRGEGVGLLAVQVQDSAGDVVAQVSLPLTGEWVRHEVRLTLARTSPTRYRTKHRTDTTYGEFALVLSVQGTGHVDLDWAVLMGGDAVRGKFNPTTLKWFRESGVGSMRWPGGNYTSLYHWEHGIGPWQERPVTKNMVWGGLDYHYLGINEYLEFCQLAGVEPYVNLGFNTPSGRGEDITPEEAARAVQYCNGDTSTEMGALRAAHGHPVPWNVKQWQLGNEVWGPLQNGHTDAATYAEEFKAYYDAMKAADPSIQVYAAGSDVWHLRLGEPPGTPPQWNKIFMDVAGPEYTDGLDIHNYVNGIKDSAERAAFMAEHGLDIIDYNQICVGYSTGEDRAISMLREQARERGVTDLKLTYGEFNVNPWVGPGEPKAHWETMANSAFVAGMFNTFIRHGDVVRHSHLVDYTILDRASTEDLWPLSPANRVRELYTDPFRMAGLTWHRAEVAITGPTFDIPESERMMPTPDVPVVDAACLVADNGERAYVYAVNRDLKQHHLVTLSVADWPAGGAPAQRSRPVTARMITSVPEDDPFVENADFTQPTAFQVRNVVLTPDSSGNLVVELPPAAVIRVRFDAATP